VARTYESTEALPLVYAVNNLEAGARGAGRDLVAQNRYDSYARISCLDGRSGGLTQLHYASLGVWQAFTINAHAIRRRKQIKVTHVSIYE
jgi:hypothetical protein